MGRRRRRYEEEEEEEEWEEEDEEPRRLRLRMFLLGLSGLVSAALIYCYQAQPDELAGLTFVPPWIWLIGALVSFVWCSGRSHKAFSLTVFALWALFGYTSIEETRSLARSGDLPTRTWQAAHDEGKAIRVVSLNCDDGKTDCAAEVKSHKPDIVLYQESPSREELQKLASDLFGSEGGFLWGPDASIVARGTVQVKFDDQSSFFVHATVQLTNGKQVEVVSLQLRPPVVRYDAWAGNYWQTHQEARIERREQLQAVMNQVRTLPPTSAIVVGGDFNAAPDDGALSPLRGSLTDAFRIVGSGWGNTGSNGYPIERTDQVWINSHFKTESCVAIKTVHSDHRMVVADLVIVEIAE